MKFNAANWQNSLKPETPEVAPTAMTAISMQYSLTIDIPALSTASVTLVFAGTGWGTAHLKVGSVFNLAVKALTKDSSWE